MLVIFIFLFAIEVFQCLKTYNGKDFVLAFIDHPRNPMRDKVTLEILGEPGTNVNVTYITYGKLNSINQRLDQSVTKISLPPHARYNTPGSVFSNGIHITATKDISVYGINSVFQSNKFPCIPTTSQSNKYIIATYVPRTTCRSLFAITAAFHKTKVRIEFQIQKFGRCRGFTSGMKTDITLEEHGVYGMTCPSDITGTVINSNKEIAVIAGMTCGAGDIKENMLIPVKFFGTKFVMTPNPFGKSSSIYRVVASERNTKLKSDDSQKWKVSFKKPRDITSTASFSVVIANKPVYVLSVVNILDESRGARRRRPGKYTNFIITPVQFTSQYLQSYKLFLGKTIARSSTPHKMDITMDGGFSAFLAHVLDDVPVRKAKRFTSKLGDLETMWALVDAQGVVTVKSRVPFGLTVYSMRRRHGLVPGGLLEARKCSNEYSYFPKEDVCLKFEPEQLVRRKARHRCRKSGGHLVDLNTEVKKELVTTILSQIGDVAFIGGFRYKFVQNSTKIWLWSDCSPVPTWDWGKGKCLAVTGGQKTLIPHRCKQPAPSVCEQQLQTPSSNLSMIVKHRKRKCRGVATQKDDDDDEDDDDSVEQQQTTIWTSTEEISSVVVSTTATTLSRSVQSTNPRTYSVSLQKTGSVGSNDERSIAPETTVPSMTKSKLLQMLDTFKDKDASVKSQDTLTDQTVSSAKLSTGSLTVTSTSDKGSISVSKHDTTTQGTMISRSRTSLPTEGMTSKTIPFKIPMVTNDKRRLDVMTTLLSKEFTNIPKKKDTQMTSTEDGRGTDPDTTSSPQAAAAPRTVGTLNMTLVKLMYLEQYNLSSDALQVGNIQRPGRRLRCRCVCKQKGAGNESDQDVVRRLKEKVKKHLIVNKTMLRKTLSKRVSVQDDRFSAAAVGCLGFVFLLLPFAIIVVSDISTHILKPWMRVTRLQKLFMYINVYRKSLSKSSLVQSQK